MTAGATPPNAIHRGPLRAVKLQCAGQNVQSQTLIGRLLGIPVDCEFWKSSTEKQKHDHWRR